MARRNAAPKPSETVTSRQLAELSDESYTTIDHWADMGLLRYMRRGRNRVYDRDLNLRLCRRIRELQQEDKSLSVIRVELRTLS